MAAPDHDIPWHENDDDDLDEDGTESSTEEPDEGPGEHDLHLSDDEESDSDTVQCPKCSKYVWSLAQRCHRCGVFLRGEAWQLADAPQTSWWSRIRRLATILLIVLMVGWLVLLACLTR